MTAPSTTRKSTANGKAAPASAPVAPAAVQPAPAETPAPAAPAQKFNMGGNVVGAISADGKRLNLQIDLTRHLRLSDSGKNYLIATSGGNQYIPGLEDRGIKIGLNLMEPNPDYRK